MNKRQHTTINIGHLADSAKFDVSTIKKTYSDLIRWSFEMPNAPYSERSIPLASLSSDSKLSFGSTKPACRQTGWTFVSLSAVQIPNPKEMVLNEELT